MNVTKLNQIFKSKNMPNLHNFLNLWAVEDEAVIGVDFKFTYCYKLVAPDLFTKSAGEIESFFRYLKNTIQSLENTKMSLTFVVSSREGDKNSINGYKNLSDDDSEISKLIIDSRCNHFEDVFIQEKKVYLFLTLNPETKDVKNLSSSPLKFGFVNYAKVNKKLHDKQIGKLKVIEDTMVSGFNSIGVGLEKLKEKEISEYIYKYLNPNRSDILDVQKLNSDQTLRSQMCFNSVSNDFSHALVDGTYYRAVNFHKRPEELNFTMLQDFMWSLPTDSDVVFTVDFEDQEILIKKLQRQGLIAKSIQSFNPFKTNYEADLREQDTRGLLDEVKQTNQKLYNFSMCVILKDHKLNNLTKKTNDVLHSFRKLGEAEGLIDDMNHFSLFLTALPGHSQLNFKKYVFHTDAIMNLIPISDQWKGSKSPEILLQTDDDQLLPIDLFDKGDNKSALNGFVLGAQGSGKSFTVNFLLSSFLAQSSKNHVVIIDDGGSYKKLCGIFKGNYLEIELTDQYAFNPFPSSNIAVITDNEGSKEIDPEVLEFLVVLIKKMLNKQEFSGQEQRILETAILNTYKYSEREAPLLSDLYKELFDYREGDDQTKKIAREEFANHLELWTTGRYGKFFNRQSKIDINSRFIVFDLKKLSEQLKGIVFFIIQSAIEKKLVDRSLRKIIVIDEAWKFFSDDVGSELIINLYKTIRKYGGLVWSISQSATDFLKTKASDSIISNSFLKIILNLQSGHELLTEFKLNENEIGLAKGLREKPRTYKEVFLKFRDNSRVVKVYPSKIDLAICSTDDEVYLKEQNIRKNQPELSDRDVVLELSKEFDN